MSLDYDLKHYFISNTGRARLYIAKDPAIGSKLKIKYRITDSFYGTELQAIHVGTETYLRRKLKEIGKNTNLFIDAK